MQQVRLRLSARGDPPQGLSRGKSLYCAHGICLDGLQRPRSARHEIFLAGCPGRLHGMRPLRGRLSRQGQIPAQAQGDQPRPAAASAPARSDKFQILSRITRNRSPENSPRCQRLAIFPTAHGVQRRLRRMRRDAVYQTADAAVGRSDSHRQRDGLFVDLRRKSAHDAVLRQP